MKINEAVTTSFGRVVGHNDKVCVGKGQDKSPHFV